MRTKFALALCLTIAPLGLALAGGSPAYLAEKKEICTTKGKVSEVCYEFWQDVVAGNNVLHVNSTDDDQLRACWNEAKKIDQQGPDSARPAAAESFMRRRAKGEEGAQNKYVDECLRLTGELMGGEWRAHAQKGVFLDTMAKALTSDFENKCGVRADLQREHGPLKVVLWGKGKGKAVVWQGDDPEGGKLAVRCDGYIVGKDKAGKAVSIAPTTIDAIRTAQNRSCISNCEMNNPACVEGARRGKTTPICAEICADKCR